MCQPWRGELAAAEERRAIDALIEVAREESVARYEKADDRAYDECRDRGSDGDFR